MSAQLKWTYAKQVEKEIQAELNKKENLPSVEHIVNLTQEFRNSCLETIFLNFEYATAQGVEARLWAVHTVIKERHKKLISRSQAHEPKNFVEVRKLQKRYVDFIKTSQHFYKGYIQRLASTYSGMKGLRRIAYCLTLDTLAADDLTQGGPQLERLVDASCHATLLRLGDLSRYRNEIRTKDRSWQPALSYYQLADNLCPESGSAHNQMAVIALAEQNHLDALYHLYRAIAIMEPHLLAKGNLEIEFKKITTAWEKNQISRTKLDSEATLVLWFVRLHAKLYKGATSIELEKEVLSRIAQLLKEQSFELTLERIVIINIAAEFFATERIGNPGFGGSEKSTDLKSHELLLKFNVRLITVLLQMLLPELEDPVSGEELPNATDGSQSTKSRDKITAIMRRILPALRQYSTWLVSRSSAISKAAGNPELFPHIHKMWSLYAEVLRRIADVFQIGDISIVNYLLEEDEMTIGFKPLRDPALPFQSNLYIGDTSGALKPRLTDPGIVRDPPDVEMSGRIRDILLCALVMYTKNLAPVTMDNGQFTFVEERLQYSSPFPAQQQPALQQISTQQSNSTISSPTRADTITSPSTINEEFKMSNQRHYPTPFDAHGIMEQNMSRMVDNLVESSRSASNETSYGMHSRTANEIFAPTGSSGSPAPMHSTQKMLPSLPGIWQSPFTPQPHELQSSPNRISSGRQLSPLRLSTVEEQMAAARALDKMTGVDRSGYNSWGRKSSRPTSASTSQPFHQNFQESLPQQSMPMAQGSSMFSDSSSIYANTPRAENRRSGGGLRAGLYFNGNNTTMYAGASDFERDTMLKSSLWDGSQPLRDGRYTQTPPGGQGG